MPSLGADMEEATLLEWHVEPGDVVHRGEVIAVVDTVKTAMEIEVFEEGIVKELIAEPGSTLAVGALMAVITPDLLEADATAPSEASPVGTVDHHVDSPLVRRRAHDLGLDPATVAATGPGGAVTRHDVEAAAQQIEATPVPPTSAPPGTRVRAVPGARRQAAALGIDLAAVPGTGPAGAVTVADVERAAASDAGGHATPATTSSAQRLAAMQEAVGKLMARSKREIPHYYLSTTIDMKHALAWLAEQNTTRTVADRLIPAALLLKATAVAARRVPEVNGFWTSDGFQAAPGVQLGVAISLRGGGLVAPAIHDADAATVEELMRRLRDLVSRARASRLRQSEMADPTLTVTNLGDLGVDEVYGVIYPPQVALVGFGRVVDRPVAVEGMLAVHPVVTATLCGDHRVSDGHRGGRFLAIIDSLLQQPEEL